jgi:hypothetical protein
MVLPMKSGNLAFRADDSGLQEIASRKKLS